MVEEGSPGLLHNDNIWFATCDESVNLEEGNHFEICLSGFRDRKLVFDQLNGNFKVTMFPEQLTREYHHMRVEAVVYFNSPSNDGNETILLTIRPYGNAIPAMEAPYSSLVLGIDRTKRFSTHGNDERVAPKTKDVGRVNMVQRPKNWMDLESVTLELMFK